MTPATKSAIRGASLALEGGSRALNFLLTASDFPSHMRERVTQARNSCRALATDLWDIECGKSNAVPTTKIEKSDIAEMAMVILFWTARTSLTFWFFLGGINAVFPVPYLTEITIGIWSFAIGALAVKYIRQWWVSRQNSRKDLTF